MFVRLVLFGAVGVLLTALWLQRDAILLAIYRLFRRLPGEQMSSDLLTPEELRQLHRLKAQSPPLEVALNHRSKIRGLVKSDRGSLTEHVDRALRKLASQAETLARLESILVSYDAEEIAGALEDAELALATAESEEALLDCQERLDGVMDRRFRGEILRKRKWDLDKAVAAVVDDVKAVHEALVVASAADMSLGRGDVRELRQALKQSSEDVRYQTAAEEELEKMLDYMRS